LLRDVDWAGIGHSLEIRTPLVDIALLRTVAPLVARLHGQSGKVALAEATTQPYPDHLLCRPKTGFSIPSTSWIASADPLHRSRGVASRDWAQTLMAGWAG
jgi:asparagine synthase (glutamine-hydrolysing)